MPTYCDTDVARAAPATPHPNTKINIMSIVKFATLERIAEIKGVLCVRTHMVSMLLSSCPLRSKLHRAYA